ncbi:MAG: hypothetical protein H7Z13_07885 [Ferruginibacter sp.]|nr:hypothetical protein [Ferruginibacter sp.]
MKHFILFIAVYSFSAAKAQKIDSIYVNLYTDSLKKGTFNYINIDGLLSDGRYLPLDSTHLIFSASAGWFSGNSLWIDNNFSDDKVSVKVILRKAPGTFKQFDIYIKKKPDNEKLKTADEIINEMKNNTRSKRKGNLSSGNGVITKIYRA